MKVNIKKLKDLERKITISIPVEDYSSRFSTKLKNVKLRQKLMVLERGMFLMMYLSKDMDNLFMQK